MTSPRTLPARHEAVEVAEFDSEIVVFETRSRQVHLLGPLASLVFDSCDSVTTIHSLVEEIVEEGGDDRPTVIAAVENTLGDLARLGLLEGTEWAAPPPCVGCGHAADPDSEPPAPGRWWRSVRSRRSDSPR